MYSLERSLYGSQDRPGWPKLEHDRFFIHNLQINLSFDAENSELLRATLNNFKLINVLHKHVTFLFRIKGLINITQKYYVKCSALLLICNVVTVVKAERRSFRKDSGCSSHSYFPSSFLLHE
jgi:hypothetical protein